MDFLFRIAILAFGYLYPAYKCFKAIDDGKPKFEKLHVWCQYWIILAVFTGFEKVADIFISWLPFYSGAKLAFIVYLWHPETKGTEYIYQALIKPYLSKHTDSVDVNLALVRDETVRALAVVWNRLLYFVEGKLSGMLHQNAALSPNVASQFHQDHLDVYPSISSSFSASKVQQQSQKQWPFSGHQPLVTQSTVWPHEQYRPQPQVSRHPVRPLDAPFRSHVQPTQLSKHQTWPLQQPAAKPHNASAITKSSMLSSTTDLKSFEGKEEADFELVHSNEVPASESSSSAPDTKKRNTSAQGARTRWWLW